MVPPDTCSLCPLWWTLCPQIFYVAIAISQSIFQEIVEQLNEDSSFFLYQLPRVTTIIICYDSITITTNCWDRRHTHRQAPSQCSFFRCTGKLVDDGYQWLLFGHTHGASWIHAGTHQVHPHGHYWPLLDNCNRSALRTTHNTGRLTTADLPDPRPVSRIPGWLYF